MPSYDYLCSSCDHKFETFHSMFAEPLRECPECKEHSLVKLISAGAAAIIRGTKNPCRGEITKRRSKLKKLGSEKSEIPDWRSSKDGKIRKDILKNPQKYINTGEV